MNQAELLGEFVANAEFYDIPPAAREQLQMRLLDAVGNAVGALRSEPMLLCRKYVEFLDGRERCTLIGGGRTSVQLAAFFNTALCQYLGLGDSFIDRFASCQPSSNFGPILAAADEHEITGKRLILALAIAYQIQCRLVHALSARRTIGENAIVAVAMTAGIAKVIGLNAMQTANAIALAVATSSGVTVGQSTISASMNALVPAQMATAAVNAAYLAGRGIIGPTNALDGPAGLGEALQTPFNIDWRREPLDAVLATSMRAHGASIHAQSAVECAIKARNRYTLDPRMIARIKVETYELAQRLLSGPDKLQVNNREQAQNSLPYLVAVALLDGRVTPRELDSQRIAQTDVQSLMRKVVVVPSAMLTAQYPKLMPVRISVELEGGTTIRETADVFPGFVRTPFTWQDAIVKFDHLTGNVIEKPVRDRLVHVIQSINETASVSDLTSALGQIERARRWAA